MSTPAATRNGKGPRKLTKNEKRRQRKKAEKSATDSDTAPPSDADEGADQQTSAVEIEYVTADPTELVSESGMQEAAAAEFREIFERFSKAGIDEVDAAAEAEAERLAAEAQAKKDAKADAAAAKKAGDDSGALTLSRKARKLQSRLSVAELKQLVSRPDVVEAHDVTAADPKLLVHLKAYRNTVPVPRHWCHKRKFLQGKRGVEKKPFELPDFIAMTGITKLRDGADDSDANKRAKQRSRDRVQPKKGKIDIDYAVLHDAFFKYQTKPKLSGVGDIYYEGKEFEVRGREKVPGQLSAELKAALGIPDGAPPPWLINMQRYGPPPSYPHLRIPGLNAPIPAGASFGYHAGGWGKPPVDEAGNPLYGDVFGTLGVEQEQAAIDKSHWGELEEESSDEEEEEQEEDSMLAEGTETPALPPTPLDGAETSMTGLETPDAMLDLRKRGLETPSDSGTPAPKELYTIVGEEKTGVGAALFGADKRYNLAGGKPGRSAATGASGSTAAGDSADVAVSIDPDNLDMQLEDTEALKERYEATVALSKPEREDVSDILAEESRKQKRKLEKSAKDKAGGGSKKSKDFKF